VEDVDHTNSRSTADTKRKQRIKMKQMSKQTPQRAPIVAFAWRFLERTTIAVPVLVRLPLKE